MDAWQAPPVPRLPGILPGPVRLYHPRSGGLEPVGPKEGQARIYACGITPYDATHLGHAATYLAVDLLNRAWLDAGLGVHYVQNITDIDDPLLERAAQTGQDWLELASEQSELFARDMAALRVVPPTRLQRVSQSIEQIAEVLAELRDLGAIYQVADAEFADWYFSVPDDSTVLTAGGLSRTEALEVFNERGGDPDRPGKRHQLDCLVWRQQRPGEPAWDTWLGRGRPGWHIGCTTIALRNLGPQFDVQAGGRDLEFPHHPMCAAEAELITGRPYADHYLHTAMVGFAGEKMSKSLGNLVFVSELLWQEIDPMAIRLLLLAQHYREDWDYTPELLDQAQDRLERWRRGISRACGPDWSEVLTRVRAAIRADLDAPTALSVLDVWMDTPGDDPESPALVAAAAEALLGVDLS